MIQRYLVISSGGHLLLLAAWLTSGALLSKPRMSYYAIDLMSSLPGSRGPDVKRFRCTGGRGRGSQEHSSCPLHRFKNANSLPRTSFESSRKAQKNPQVAPKPPKKHGLDLKAALAVLDGQRASPLGRTQRIAAAACRAVAVPGSWPMQDRHSRIPWYLKAIADCPNHQWHPLQDISGRHVGAGCIRDSQRRASQ